MPNDRAEIISLFESFSELGPHPDLFDPLAWKAGYSPFTGKPDPKFADLLETRPDTDYLEDYQDDDDGDYETADDVEDDNEPICIKSLATEQERSDRAEKVMRLLGLPFSYYSAVLAVLNASEWKASDNPIAYVKSASRREAFKRGLSEGRDESLSLRKLEHERDKRRKKLISAYHGPFKKFKPVPSKDDRYYYPSEAFDHSGWDSYPGSNRPGVHRDLPTISSPELSYNCDPDGRVIPCYGAQELNLDLLAPDAEDLGSTLKVDWDRVICRWGLDEAEETVFRLKQLEGLGRSEILKRASDAHERLSLQAAYKRLDRKMPSLRPILAASKK